MSDGWHLTCEVRGDPVPQGAIRHFGTGRPAVHANRERLLPWRQMVQLQVEAAMARIDAQWPETGPVDVQLVFTVKKPASAPKRKQTWPITRPDLDKLTRALLDALVNAGALRDDSQVISIACRKVYPNEAPGALSSPGVSLILSPSRS